MGYTHDIRRSRPFTESEWRHIVDDTNGILAAAQEKGIQIGGGGWDIAGNGVISFNGVAEGGSI